VQLMRRLNSIANVFLWQIELDRWLPTEAVWGAMRLASDHELERVHRFRNPSDGLRFLGCRVALRCVLAQMTKQHPSALRFRHGAAGKPYLSSGDVSFSVSHSDGRGVIAVTRRASIGIDIERRRHLDDRSALARAVFSQREFEEFEQSGSTSETFLQVWTRKEALVKSTGEGVQAMGGYSVPVRALDACGTWTPTPEYETGMGRSSGCTLYELSDCDYIGALAVSTSADDRCVPDR
jgi:phosphopantetheinyl transferase